MPIWIFIYLLLFYFIFLEGGGGLAGWGALCVVLSYISSCMGMCFQYFYFIIIFICYVVIFVLIWKFDVSFLSHTRDYTPDCIQISMIYLYFSFFWRAALAWFLPYEGLYFHINWIFRVRIKAQHLQYFAYQVFLLAIIIL